MPTVLIGWELGGGLGHVMRAAALAKAFARQDFRVVVALADLADCARINWPGSVLIVAAPQPHRRPAGFDRAANFAELIYGSGYHDVHQVTGLVTAWSNLIDLSAADVVVADHAPSAHLAARLCGVPLVRIGSGFFAPPPATRTPIYRTWEAVDETRLEAADRHVLDVFNMTGKAGGLAAWANVAEALTPDLDLVTSWPELDCYATLRPEGSVLHIGNEYAGTAGGALQWPLPEKGARPRVVAYLKSGYGALEAVLETLGQHVEAIAVVAGLSDAERRGLTREHVALPSQPISLGNAAQQADVLLCHAGAGSAPWFLAAGKPVLLLPYSAEQMVNATMLKATGAAEVVLIESVAAELSDALKLLTQHGRYRLAARQLAERWATQPDSATLAADHVAALIEAPSSRVV